MVDYAKKYPVDYVVDKDGRRRSPPNVGSQLMISFKTAGEWARRLEQDPDIVALNQAIIECPGGRNAEEEEDRVATMRFLLTKHLQELGYSKEYFSGMQQAFFLVQKQIKYNVEADFGDDWAAEQCSLSGIVFFDEDQEGAKQ